MRRSAIVLLSVLVLMVSGASPVGARKIESFHLLVTGAAEILASNCSWDAPVDSGTECVDTYVLYAQEGVPNQQVRRRPWYVLVFETTVLINIEGTPPTVVHERFGLLEDPVGSMDIVRLRTASVTASVPMDDGSTYDVDLDWDMSDSPFHVSGNDGPINNDVIPWGSHLVDDCLTQNFHAHQSWRRGDGGAITGTLDGTDVNDLLIPSDEPFVGRGVFTITIASHGDCL